jgi:hypothetical protein
MRKTIVRRPRVGENWAIMVVQPAILTYPTMVFYFWIAPQVLWNDLRGIVIKQRHLSSFLFLEPSVSQKNAKNHCAVLPGISVTVLASHLSSVIGNFRSSGWVLLYIFIKQRHLQTSWDIIHVCQAIVETASGRKLSHNGCTAGNFDIPDHGFLLLNCSRHGPGIPFKLRNRQLPVLRVAWSTCMIPQTLSMSLLDNYSP